MVIDLVLVSSTMYFRSRRPIRLLLLFLTLCAFISELEIESDEEENVDRMSGSDEEFDEDEAFIEMTPEERAARRRMAQLRRQQGENGLSIDALQSAKEVRLLLSSRGCYSSLFPACRSHVVDLLFVVSANTGVWRSIRVFRTDST